MRVWDSVRLACRRETGDNLKGMINLAILCRLNISPNGSYVYISNALEPIYSFVIDSEGAGIEKDIGAQASYYLFPGVPIQGGTYGEGIISAYIKRNNIKIPIFSFERLKFNNISVPSIMYYGNNGWANRVASTGFSLADIYEPPTFTALTITTPELPDNAMLYFNEVEVPENTAISIDSNQTMRLDYTPPISGRITFTYANAQMATYNGQPIVSGSLILPEGNDNTLDVVGALTIPQVELNGEGVNTYSVNGVTVTPDNFPYTFTPLAGMVNAVFANGQAAPVRNLTIAGTNIEEVTINGEVVTLPYKVAVEEDKHIAVAGRVYQVDVLGIGGAKISKDGVILTDGNDTYHGIIDVTKDTYFTFDGTHDLNITGSNLHGLNVNGVDVPITSLPVKISNRKMSIDVEVIGNLPSEINITGTYLREATLDGLQLPVTDDGHLFYEFETIESSHALNLIGSQPREYGITWQDNGTTQIFMDGKLQTNGTTAMISKDVLVATYPLAVPVHFEKPSNVVIDVNGRMYTANDFTIQVDQDTEIDIRTDTCTLTIDYADNSFTLEVPQSRIVITAPHRDGWRFDSWSSTDAGIESSKTVRTVVDLEGKTNVHLVAHYERYLVMNKPEIWSN